MVPSKSVFMASRTVSSCTPMRSIECATAERSTRCAESAAQEGLAAGARDAAMEVPINVRRFMGGILLLPRGKGTEIRWKRERGRLLKRRLPEQRLLELEPQAELHAARGMGTGR